MSLRTWATEKSGTEAVALVANATALGGEPVEAACESVEAYLGRPLAAIRPCPASSALDAEGWPLQACLSYASGTAVEDVALRFIVDPGVEESDPKHRFRKALGRLGVFQPEEVAGRAAIFAWLNGLAKRLSPRDPVGHLWIATDATRRRLAVYVNLGADIEPWTRARAIAGGLLLSEVAWQDIEALLAGCCRPVALAAEIGDGRPRLKLYLRPVAPLPDLSEVLFQAASTAAFISAVTDGRRWPASGITLGLGFSLVDGQLCDSKLDLCLCTRCCGAAAPMALRRAALALDLALPEAEQLAGWARPALLGLGATASGRRFNLYLQPWLSGQA